MCRFLVYVGPTLTLADVITRPQHSLIHQSFKSEEREEPLNGDGFGVAWYAPKFGTIPALFKSVTPAWADRNLEHVARVTQSGCIFAHIRAATPGLPVTNTNCHPFVSGDLAFMHNGFVAGFRRIRQRLLGGLSGPAFDAIEGTTDSEHIFAILLDEMEKSGGSLADIVMRTVRRVSHLAAEVKEDEETYLNVAVTNGRQTVATRFVTGEDPSLANTLYIHRDRKYVCDDDVCHLVESPRAEHSILICSEPLTRGDRWQPVPPNHLVVIGEQLQVEVQPIGA